jgi:Zn-finger nucleic acid-binding protein
VLVIIEHDDVRTRECPNGHGSFLGTFALEHLTQLKWLRAGTTDGQAPTSRPRNEGPTLQELAAKVFAENTRESIYCLDCLVEMEKDQVHPMIPVDVDICPKCHCAWLDAREMELISGCFSNWKPALTRKSFVCASALPRPRNQWRANWVANFRKRRERPTQSWLFPMG